MALSASIKVLGALGVLSMAVAVSGAARAAMTAEELARLGKDLTPAGAEMAGSADGSIPAWDGGLIKPPAGFDPAKGYADPYAGEQPLFTITGANLDSYKDRLAPGQIELLKRYPTYKMVVYPSHRSAALPEREVEAIRKESPGAQLAEGGSGVVNAQETTVPFPVPKRAEEVMWNHLMRYRGGTFIRYGTEFPVQTDGSFTPLKRTEWWARASAIGNPEPNRLSYYLSLVNGPASIAGEAILSHEPLDQVSETRRSWTYNPGQRRVLRAPEIAYDSPGTGSDGLRTMDDYDGFNGALDRYDWKLLGKKEMFVAYNNYRLTDKSLKYSDLVKEKHLNQDYVRYEPHRVWVVEATLKPGARHIYAKRVFYIDEDSWQILHKDQYDGRGELWRVHEILAFHQYDVLATYFAADAVYDLQARRYLVHDLCNEEKPGRYGVPLDAGKFSPDNLRRISN